MVDGAALEKRCAKAPRVRIPPSPPQTHLDLAVPGRVGPSAPRSRTSVRSLQCSPRLRCFRSAPPCQEPPFEALSTSHVASPRRGRLVDYGAALEMRFGETRRGFESRPLRQAPIDLTAPCRVVACAPRSRILGCARYGARLRFARNRHLERAGVLWPFLDGSPATMAWPRILSGVPDADAHVSGRSAAARLTGRSSSAEVRCGLAHAARTVGSPCGISAGNGMPTREVRHVADPRGSGSGNEREAMTDTTRNRTSARRRSGEMEGPSVDEDRASAGGGAVYGLGMIGALVYFFQRAETMSDHGLPSSRLRSGRRCSCTRRSSRPG